MEEKMDQILKNQADLLSRIGSLETAITGMRAESAEMRAETSDMREALTKMHEETSDMREENGKWFAEITTGISSYRDDQDRTVERVERLEDAIKSAGYGNYLQS